MNNESIPAQNAENKDFISELAIRIANLEVERAAYKTQLISSQQEVVQLTQELNQLKSKQDNTK